MGTPHPNGGVECRWGIGTNRDSGLTAGYRRLLDVRSAKNIYRRRSWVYDTDRTVGDAPANVCLWRPAAWTNTAKRREQKRIELYAVVYLKPKQLIINDCARHFVSKLYRHEASRGLLATAELLVKIAGINDQLNCWCNKLLTVNVRCHAVTVITLCHEWRERETIIDEVCWMRRVSVISSRYRSVAMISFI